MAFHLTWANAYPENLKQAVIEAKEAGYTVEAQQNAPAQPDLRRCPPLPESHPLVTLGDLCPACKEPFRAGDVTTFIPLGPGRDAEARAAARAGRCYTGVAAAVHYSCATGEEA